MLLNNREVYNLSAYSNLPLGRVYLISALAASLLISEVCLQSRELADAVISYSPNPGSVTPAF